METYLKPYGDIEQQRRMVSDRPRTDAFASAISEVVRHGDVVLDIGTGTGILAMLAAKAGAKTVYAVDATDIAHVAADLVRTNGLSDKVRVIHGRAGELQLDQEVDLIISEWLGNAVFAEGMIHAVLDARERHLKPNGRMLPARVRVMIAPLDEPIMYNTEGPGFWRAPIHGLDFSSLQNVELDQGRPMQIRIEPAAVLAAGQSVIELDMRTAAANDIWFDGQLHFVPIRDGVLNGFCIWFEADLAPNVMLDTSPFRQETHWAQTYVSFPPRSVRAGQQMTVDVRFAYDPDPSDISRYVDLHLAVGDSELESVID